MKNLIRLALGLVVCVGGYLIHQSYTAYARWHEYVTLRDFSGAELYEVEFWLTALPGFTALVGGAFFLGVTFAKRNHND